MRENEMPAGMRQHPDGQGTNNYDVAITSRSDDNTIERDKQARILDLLQHGETAAIPARELAAILNTDKRGLRMKVDAERESGTAILASERGYFLPSQDHAEALAEARRFVARQDSRLRSNRRNVEAARRMLAALEIEASGQLSMEGETYAES